MDPMKIGCTIPAERTHGIIEKISSKKKVDINYEEFKDRYIYSFSLKKKTSQDGFDTSDIAAQFANEMIMEFYISDLIKKRYRELLFNKKNINTKQLLKQIYLLIRNESLFNSERIRIESEIHDFIMANNILIVDGYLRFRPRSFNNLIDRAMDIALNQRQIEMEYDEFINMLKYFIDTNPPEIDLVNLIIRNKDFELLDSRNKKINNKSIVEMLEGVFQGDINKSDIILSSLIGLSPKQIIVHVCQGESEELIEILRKIFTHRIKICYGCSLCGNKQYKD